MTVSGEYQKYGNLTTKLVPPPSVMIIFLEILFNTLFVTLQIADYLKEVRGILSDWLNKWSATLTELQSLLRKLNFTYRTVRAGRIFMARIINKMKRFPKQGKGKISGQLKTDISWWYTFLTVLMVLQLCLWHTETVQMQFLLTVV